MADVAEKVRDTGLWPLVKKRWRAWLRAFHRDFGYLAIGFTVIYAISGIAQNHIEDWGEVSYRTYETTKTIAPIADELPDADAIACAVRSTSTARSPMPTDASTTFSPWS